MRMGIKQAWRCKALEEEFNRRQMVGEPCDDLVKLMIRELSLERPFPILGWPKRAPDMIAAPKKPFGRRSI
jgi:hypothetical protein